jgi:hypothetical protein
MASGGERAIHGQEMQIESIMWSIRPRRDHHRSRPRHRDPSRFAARNEHNRKDIPMRPIIPAIAVSILCAIATAPARADTELDRLCSMAVEHVRDCDCATRFLSSRLTAADARTILTMWAADAQRSDPSAAKRLSVKYDDADRAASAFVGHWTNFQTACPSQRLDFDGAAGLNAEVSPSITGSIPQSWVRYDIAVTTFIEEHGEAGDVATARLVQAADDQITARKLCMNGRVAEGLALYDRILGVVPSSDW